MCRKLQPPRKHKHKHTTDRVEVSSTRSVSVDDISSPVAIPSDMWEIVTTLTNRSPLQGQHGKRQCETQSKVKTKKNTHTYKPQPQPATTGGQGGLRSASVFRRCRMVDHSRDCVLQNTPGDDGCNWNVSTHRHQHQQSPLQPSFEYLFSPIWGSVSSSPLCRGSLHRHTPRGTIDRSTAVTTLYAAANH